MLYAESLVHHLTMLSDSLPIHFRYFTLQARTAVHHAIKAQFGDQFATRTDMVAEMINASWTGGSGGRGGKRPPMNAKNGQRSRDQWPAGAGEYCKFLLYKENKGTMDAVELLSKFTKTKSFRFGYAGTKVGTETTNV